MPPVNDNIASAQTISGLSGSVQGDNTSGTLETGEGTCLGYDAAGSLGYGGGRSVWYKYTPAVSATLTLIVSDPTMGSPITDSILTVIDGTNFGTATQLAQNDDFTGLGTYSKVSFSVTAGNTYYIAVDGYNGTATDDGGYLITDTSEGGFTLTWLLVAQYVLDAAPGANLGSSTVSLQTGSPQWVRDVQIRDKDDFTSVKTNHDYVVSFGVDTSGVVDGVYEVELYSRFESDVADTGTEIFIQIRRNGIPVGYVYPIGSGVTNNVAAWRALTDINHKVETGPVMIGSLRGIKVTPGDTLEFAYGQNIADTTPLRYFEVQQVRLTSVAWTADNTPSSITSATEIDLGGTSANIDLKLYGGTDGNSSEVTYGMDMAILDDGTIFIVFNEQTGSFGGQPANLIVRKWDGASWTTVTDDLSGWGVDNGYYFNRPSISTDGTDVWVAWGETRQGTGSLSSRGWWWRCKKYDVGGASWTELGSGQTAFPGLGATATNDGDYGHGVRIRVSPAGVPWVTFAATDDGFDVQNPNYPYVWYWDGAAWQDSGLPIPATAPSSIVYSGHTHSWSTAADQQYLASGITDIYYIDLTFCHHDGPSEHPAACYNLWWVDQYTPSTFDYGEWIYYEWDGAAWGNEVRFTQAKDLWPALMQARDTALNSAIIKQIGGWQQGFTLDNDGSVPYLFAQLGWRISAVDHIAVAKLKTDGSAFEEVGGTISLPDDDLGAVDNAGTWTTGLLGGLIVGTTPVAAWMFSAGLDPAGMTLAAPGDPGSGYGWTTARNHCPLFEQHWINGAHRAHGNDIYIMAEMDDMHSPDYQKTYLGVWKWTLNVGGVVSMNWRSSQRADVRRVLQ